jgi:hypothetical protein
MYKHPITPEQYYKTYKYHVDNKVFEHANNLEYKLAKAEQTIIDRDNEIKSIKDDIAKQVEKHTI